MAGQTITKLAAERIYGDRFGDRFVDLAVELREWGDSETVILEVGGRWDRELGRWHSEAKTACVWRVQPAQYEAAHWFARWLTAHVAGEALAGDEHTRTVLAAGGRRGGKSDWAVRCLAMYTLACRGSIVWAISETQEETTELRSVLDHVLVPSWYRWREAREVYELWNGSVLAMKSGYKPSSLKMGRVDCWLMNEAQKFPRKAYTILRAPLADNRGLGLCTANPPDDPRGQWVLDVHDHAQAKRGGWRLFHFDARRNPTVDWASLESMKDDPAVSETEYRREILGEFIPIGDRVFHAWSTRESVRVAPELGDVTSEFTQRHLGTAYAEIVVADFQVYPHMAATVWRVYRDPAGEELAWIVGEAIVDEGDEDMLIDELERQGLDPKHTIAIGDASGEWQGGKRQPGRDSFKVFRRRGWKIIPPDAKQKRNPDIVASCRVANGLMKNAAGKRRMFCDPDCVRTKTAIARWPTRNGAPYKRSDYAHSGDTVRYFAWRFWPRRGKKKKFAYHPVKRGRSRREQELDGW